MSICVGSAWKILGASSDVTSLDVTEKKEIRGSDFLRQKIW